MKITTSTLLATAMMLVATKAQTEPTRVPFGTGELPEFLKVYDINGDGKLSTEERLAYEKAIREARPPRPGVKNPWDTDGDGKLSEAERLAAREAIAAKIRTERTKRFNELDTNTDGFLDNAELLLIPRITPAQVTAMLARLDKDADGKISLAEFLAALTPVDPPFPHFPLPQPPPPFPIPAPPILRSFDTNNDRMLSPAEVAALILAVDSAGGDGRVSPEEWRAYLVAHPELLPTPPTPPAP